MEQIASAAIDVPADLNEAALKRFEELVEADAELDADWKRAVAALCQKGLPINLDEPSVTRNGGSDAQTLTA